MEDLHFRQILDHFGYSWAGYRKVRKGVKKRVGRHMHKMQCINIEAYIEAIEKDHEKWLQFEQLMTVSISRFFRDKGFWEILKRRILPLLFQKTSQTIKVWSAGCAAGEEVYTFKILWDELRKSYTNIPHLYILATDLRPENLDRAKAAVFSRSSIKEVPDKIRFNYFEAYTKGRYVLKFGKRGDIVWRIHHLLSDPQEIEFDLIFLRNNLLTYYKDEVKIPAIINIVNSLVRGGFFIIGSHEEMPIEVADLKPWDERKGIFQKHNNI